MASFFEPMCAVPRFNFVDDPVGGARKVAECSKVEARVMAGVLLTIAAVLLVIALVVNSKTKAGEKPAFPLWPSLLLAGIAVLQLVVGPWIASRHFQGLVATFLASGMTKDEWVKQGMENSRAQLSADATFGGATMIASALSSSNSSSRR